MMEFIQNKATVFENIVPTLKCEDLIEWAKTRKFILCKYNDDVNENHRDSFEIRVRDKGRIKSLWDHVKKLVPEMCNGSTLIGPDYKKVYLLKYSLGQKFKKHYDGHSIDSKGNKSLITIIIYLNGGDTKSLRGGNTRFYSEPGTSFEEPFENAKYFDVVPKTGSMLMFTHKLLHEGLPVDKGTKYCIRFNVLYNTTKKLKTDNDQMYTKMKRFTSSSPNGLKACDVNYVKDGNTFVLTPDRRNKHSRQRWSDVFKEPRIFKVVRYRGPMFVDKRQERPPSNNEDFCPNCYEILPLVNTYKNCPNCLFDIVDINHRERKKRMIHTH